MLSHLNLNELDLSFLHEDLHNLEKKREFNNNSKFVQVLLQCLAFDIHFKRNAALKTKLLHFKDSYVNYFRRPIFDNFKVMHKRMLNTQICLCICANSFLFTV